MMTTSAVSVIRTQHKNYDAKSKVAICWIKKFPLIVDGQYNPTAFNAELDLSAESSLRVHDFISTLSTSAVEDFVRDLEFTGNLTSANELAKKRLNERKPRNLTLGTVNLTVSGVLWIGVAILAVAIFDQPLIHVNPREITIATSLNNFQTNENSVVITGSIGKELRAAELKTINLYANGNAQPASINNGVFTSRV